MADSTRDVERQVFILDEAEEELDWGDEDEDALSAPDLLVWEEQERARQKAESVKLKDRSERSLLENVVSRWEQRLNETAADETQNPTIPHRKHHPLAPSTPSPSPSRASLPPEPPAPVLHLGNAGTSHPALQSLPVPPSSPHPSPAAPEARSTSLALPAYPPSTESPGDIALAAPKAKAPAPTPSAHTQSSEGSGEVSLAAPEAKSSPVSATLSYPPPLHAPSPEGSRDVFLPAPQVKLTVPAPQAQSPSVQSPSPGTDGDLSLPSPESQLLFLAPAPSMEGSGTVSRAAQDNSFLMDVDPPQREDPLSENGEGDIPMANQTSGKVKVVIDDHEDSADEFESEHNISDMTDEQHELAKWIKEHNIPTSGPFPYHVYHVRCKRGSERAIVERINEDIACGTVSSNLIRAAFISQFPGGFYLQARSMLPGNVPLALYLNLFPNLIHPRGKKFSLREEWDQLRLGMPLHTLVDDLSGTEDSKRMFYGNNFRPGTWVVPTKGLYRGDTGLVVFDDFNEIDEETECLVLLIPRAKFPESHPLNTSNSPLHPTNPSSRRKVVSQSAADNVDIEITPSDRQSQFRLPDFEGAGYPAPLNLAKRPLQLHSSIDFRRDVETQWKAACTLSPKLKGVKFEARCFQRCENAMACQHEPPFQKRFIFDRLVLRGGLALVPHKFGDLKIAESIDDGLLRTFLQYPNADVLPSRLPPSLSWSFTSGETVIYVPDGTELQDVVKGDEGVIQRDGSLECEVLFSRSQVNVSVLKRHLRKTWRLAQVVELSPHTPEVVLRKQEQLGYSGVSTLHEDHFMPAGQTGIITKVRLDEVDVWITGINSICTVHPNSVREVVESSVSPGLESRFQPRLSNVGATIALKPGLLGIQRDGNLDQKADLAEIADSFISHEVNRFDLRRGEYRAQNRSTAMTSMLTSVDQMSSFLNPTIPSTLFGYVATEGVVPRTEYTGQIPWMHVEVKPISGERKGYLGRVYDVKSEWKNTKSGLLVLIRFQTPSLVGNLDEWYDYDHLRRADNGGFIHESTFTKKISSYFNFSKGYIPRHREDELPVTNLSTDPTNADGSRTPKSHWTAIDYSVPAWDPSSRTPNPYASSSSLTMSTPPAKHWILDSRICKGLGGREIWVNVHLRRTPFGFLCMLGLADSHVGGRKVNVARRSVDYRAILSNPRCSKVTKGHSASGLYIICEGKHTGKLVRRANYFAEQNLWVLQRIPGNDLAMVHEARSDSEAGNQLMCIIRKASGGNTNGYDVDGHGRIVKLGRP
ncbi:hypothetical protein DFJ43DRAFT_1038187 [Lentinula guzmanii]|uniref:Chromatin elongation factor spt5 n=1 Tax=Lentinula guzmanii TaxID=2804957 RepID=A0AA38JC11_9AGAR|nr:hypothetical protein DFJ43DRAFT_1038187 [Lentinula guzmanii]